MQRREEILDSLAASEYVFDLDADHNKTRVIVIVIVVSLSFCSCRLIYYLLEFILTIIAW